MLIICLFFSCDSSKNIDSSKNKYELSEIIVNTIIKCSKNNGNNYHLILEDINKEYFTLLIANNNYEDDSKLSSFSTIINNKSIWFYNIGLEQPSLRELFFKPNTFSYEYLIYYKNGDFIIKELKVFEECIQDNQEEFNKLDF